MNTMKQGVMKALQCPFLTRIPLGQVRQHSAELLQMADRCPVMGHIMKYSSAVIRGGSGTEPAKDKLDEGQMNKCPYLAHKMHTKSGLDEVVDLTLTADSITRASSAPLTVALQLNVGTAPKVVMNSGIVPRPDVMPSKPVNDEAVNGVRSPLKNFNSLKNLNLDDNGRELFDYEAYFHERVEEKKRDNTYRVFKKVSRKATEFPLAVEHTGGKKDITVWCINDYLGMSWHPQVQKAVVEAV